MSSARALTAGQESKAPLRNLAALDAKDLLSRTRIPPHGVALLQALRFSGADRKALKYLRDPEWASLLEICDSGQLTLLLGYLCGPFLPEWVRSRIDRNYADNAHRFGRVKAATLEISDRLSQQSIDFALLKGFSHSPALTPDPLLRAQGDIDIWCRPERIYEARDALLSLGYSPVGKSAGRHLDPMIRETDWQWRGDYFARDLPIPVDLHYKLWDEELERLPGPVEADIWARRAVTAVDRRLIPALGPEDSVAFAALHLMMHVLHGDPRLQRAWELGYVLSNRLFDNDFWFSWQSLYGAKTRELQVIAFQLSDRWFGCGLPDVIEDEARRFPPDVSLWIDRYAFSPVEALFAPNKDEIWLNLALLSSFRDKAHILSRRLLPLRAGQRKVQSEIQSTTPEKKQPVPVKLLAQRAAYHTRTLVPTCVQGLKWCWLRQRLGRDFLVFVFCSVLFDFGEFIFFLLYNLYLLDRGYTEQFLGQVSAALTAGTFVAVLPVAAVTRRIGPRYGVILGILGTVSATVLRALVPWKPALIGAAFLNGAFMSFWAVSLPPAVAALTNARNRTLAFSFITSLGIGIGSLAGLIGGRLPSMLAHANPSLSSAAAKQIVLLVGSGLAVFALFPAMLLRFPTFQAAEAAKKVYPRHRFIYTFLAALFIWTVGTGAFNPFFNAYFSRHLQLSVERIGAIFSYGQMAQVVVILLAPAIAVKIGEVKSVACMQLATAGMLVLLAFVSNPWLAGIVYVAYMCFQYMTEPSLFSMLMTRVAPSEQSGASAMNFLVTSLAGILAALGAGALFPKAGYRFTLMVCASVTVAAAGLFYRLLRR